MAHKNEIERHEVIESAVTQILTQVGEDPSREGLLATPNRVARMYDEILAGYTVDPVKLINGALFAADSDDIVVVRNIDYYSMCEHHLLPFFGKAHVAYVPNEKVVGLSKIPRVVDMFAQRLQIQERMTLQIAEFLQKAIGAQGVAVVVEGQHLCAAMRGVKKHEAELRTSAVLGTFKTDADLRKEFFDLIR